MAAAVMGLSPVIMTERMPTFLKLDNFSFMPSFSTSFSRTAPSTLEPSTTRRGVPPCLAISSTAVLMLAGMLPDFDFTYSSIASLAPFLISLPSMSIPLMRVSALKAIKVEPSEGRMSFPLMPKTCLARSTMLLPSGVSSAREDSMADTASSSLVTPSAGMNSVAILLPRVMVPVLSSRTTSTFPDASTALPLRATTLWARSLSMPAMPMAGKRPPMVVGMRQTSSATSTGIAKVTPM